MSIVKRYDRYGRPAGYINPINNQVDAYLVLQAPDGTVYQCFYETGSDPRAIWRIRTVDGVTQITITWAVWIADAATLAGYTWYPVNDYFETTDGVLTHPAEPAPELDAADAEPADTEA